LYKEAKYDLIEHKAEKCRLKVKKGLEMHPFHTQFLILSAYLHRAKEEYELALADLELANKHLEDRSLEEELRSQISLTYNEMGIFLYRQGKFSEALTLFSEGLAFKAGDWGMLTNRGDCHRASSNFVRAL
jgi:tetratricopeptide (TPR) repeat protein